jgi:4-hydroxy-2-oxoheptanedioate aldolase
MTHTLAESAMSGERPHLRSALRSGRPVLGTFVQLGDPTALEVLARSGYDFALLDLEHGGLTLEAAMGLLRASAVTSFPLMVRLPVARLPLVDQLLDSGAIGILVARVTNVADAEAAVRAIRYPPDGERGACPGTRANDYGALSWPDHVARADAEIVVGVALEGTAAIDDAADILDVPGIDVAFVGIFDLAASLGLPGATDHPVVVAAVEGIAARCAERGIAAGTWSPTIDVAQTWFRRGATFLPVSTDVRMWRDACIATTAAWQAIQGPDVVSPGKASA